MNYGRYILFSVILSGCFIYGYGQTKPADDPAEKAIYIPADQRHKGLSKYDLIPFTDREKGDPDRYRAVNPKYVKRENGNYYYTLKIKPNTIYYDDKGKEKGVLNLTTVDVDLANRKTGKNKNGGEIKFVFVKDRGYVQTSTIEQNSEEIRDGKWFAFPLKSGENGLYDGTGIERGKIAAEDVRLNYGLQKEIGGETYYYAFSTKINANGKNVGASGWIKASAIEKGNDPQFDQAFVAKMQMPTAANDVFKAYEITGGDEREIIGKDAAGAPVYRFGYLDASGSFITYKVLPKVPLEGRQSVEPTDYLKRSDGVINLGFNPAGVSNDTFRIEGANRPLMFYRSSEKDATVEIDMFYPKDATHDGETPVGRMVFVYGYVAVPNGKRWGWIPLAALKPAPTAVK